MRATENDVDDDVDAGVEMEEGEIPMGIEQVRAGQNLKIYFVQRNQVENNQPN